MAVWYFSRSHSVKSETFDFTEDIRTFIRVFLSFAYATREQMGYDPTVHRIKEEGESRYVYEIPTENGIRYFKAIDSLAHPRVLCITGRKTRVWKAIEVKGFEGNAVKEELNGGKEVALKDVWLDDGSTTEKQKLDAILERLKTIKEEAYEWAPLSLRSKLKADFEDGSYRSYFMEIGCDSFNLGRSKPTSDKATPAPELLQFSGKGVEAPAGSDSEREESVEDPNLLDGSTQTTGYSRITQDDLQEKSLMNTNLVDKTRSYTVKRQYRLVYNEVGESLERVQTLDTAFTALMDAYIALVLMYLAGWMHRDVSAGNIIAVKRPGGKSGGRISDLEYAKHYRDESASLDPKTGTPFFMPLEIHTGIPFNHTRITPDSFEIDPFNNLPPADHNFPRQTGPTLPPPQRAKHRFQHDLESLWWVALYILIYRVAHRPGKKLSGNIFTRSRVPTGARRQLFEGGKGGIAWALWKHLHSALQLDSIVNAMSTIPPILRDSYLMGEPVDPEALGELYSNIFRYLGLLFVTIKTKVQDIALRPKLTVKSKKRVHSMTSSKGRDGDEYEGEEEPSSDDAVPSKKKKASTHKAVRR
ncbi:hypothetical protein Agabi119p4_5247 [Agaricus bisporus var. burnettii]|uniref:Fungal-type protein kinase domain-containing protein n=1 Tax=Agaricus bisporus var. burnettii TaxID=192524 RepID=A0A8H7F4U4_AGABI|nr:hypothetical protein Agabi119p4_5247 [Agaricus bisporus var. burnettii]